MTTALILGAPHGAAVAPDSQLEAVGIHVLGATQRHTLVRDCVRFAPDVLICWDDEPDEELFDAFSTLTRAAPCPVVLFTMRSDAARIAQGVEAGVHAYVVGGYEARRLRPLIHVAQARFKADQALRGQLNEMTSRYEERTLVDRAKGILMKAGGLSEDEAFKMLRSASQRMQRRVGQVSRRLIDAARAAESVNLAGQLRMLSQRIVKLQALRVAGVEGAGATALLEQSSRRVRSNLDALEQLLSEATHGDLRRRIAQAWSGMESALQAPPDREGLGDLDRLAEALLVRSDRLVSELGGQDPTGRLQAINLCGRQRMLSQRLAKQALLAHLADPTLASASAEGVLASVAEFEQALQQLGNSGDNDVAVRAQLDEAGRCWSRLRDSLPRAADDRGRLELAAASEELLEIFERLTDRLEHSLSVLLGSP